MFGRKKEPIKENKRKVAEKELVKLKEKKEPKQDDGSRWTALVILIVTFLIGLVFYL